MRARIACAVAIGACVVTGCVTAPPPPPVPRVDVREWIVAPPQAPPPVRLLNVEPPRPPLPPHVVANDPRGIPDVCLPYLRS